MQVRRTRVLAVLSRCSETETTLLHVDAEGFVLTQIQFSKRTTNWTNYYVHRHCEFLVSPVRVWTAAWTLNFLSYLAAILKRVLTLI